MGYLHDRKPNAILHRDLKSSNILLKDQIVKLCDFGTACDVKTVMTNDRGTIAWMAPEVFIGPRYDEKCDVYSFGVLMWELIMRKKPFADYTQYQIMDKVAQNERPTLPNTFPSSIRELICQCWSQNPAERPDFKEIYKSLDRIEPQVWNYRETVSNKDFTVLLSEDYCSFSVDKIYGLEEEYTLTYFQFVEIVLEWILSNSPSQDDVDRLWGNIRQSEMSYGILHIVRYTILRTFPYRLSIPKIPGFEFTNEDKSQGNYARITTLLRKPSELTSGVCETICCERCKTWFDIKNKFVNKSPCYEVEVESDHCVVEHMFITMESNDDSYFPPYLSLHTNTYDSVIEKIKDGLPGTRMAKYFVIMWTCSLEREEFEPL